MAAKEITQINFELLPDDAQVTALCETFRLYQEALNWVLGQRYYGAAKTDVRALTKLYYSSLRGRFPVLPSHLVDRVLWKAALCRSGKSESSDKRIFPRKSQLAFKEGALGILLVGGRQEIPVMLDQDPIQRMLWQRAKEDPVAPRIWCEGGGLFMVGVDVKT